MPRIYQIGLAVVVAALGLYLTILHYTGVPVGCPPIPATGGLVNCQAVLTSPGSVILGVPLALWGSLWALASLIGKRLRIMWTGCGVLGLLWAWIHEWQVGHLCLWCTAMQIGVLLILVTLWYPRRVVQES